MLVRAKAAEIVGSMKPRISMSKPSMLKPTTDPASAFQAYRVTTSSARAICVLAGDTLFTWPSIYFVLSGSCNSPDVTNFIFCFPDACVCR